MSLQIEHLEQSFEQIKPYADKFVERFYHNLFTDYPPAQPLFANSDMASQRQKLLNALILVIENLRQPDVLSKALRGLGARHVQYGALPEHYPLVGRSLLKTFEQSLGTDWTPDVQQAWSEAYAAIAALMLEGSQYTPDQINLTPPGETAPVD
jgi:nitric oxide dioxygenase